jgi:hypothetical protein
MDNMYDMRGGRNPAISAPLSFCQANIQSKKYMEMLLSIGELT